MRSQMTSAAIDYNKLFEHVAGLKKVLLVATGRTGSDFFQSLLDGHPEILQFTGKCFFHRFWDSAKCKEDLSDLINEFLWHTGTIVHIGKFKSYYEKMERWDKLGEGRNEYFEVNVDLFKEHMLAILANRGLTCVNFLHAVHLAYGLTCGVDIERTKILFYHIHHIKKLKEFAADFSGFDVIAMTREPRNTLISNMEHWKRYDAEKYSSKAWLGFLKRTFGEAEPVLEYTRHLKVLKLEDLHLFSESVMKEFCGTYGLRLEKSMLESTYHGKKWWGDKLSVAYLDGFNENIKKEKWKDKLSRHDNFLIEYLLEDRLRHYGYEIESSIWPIHAIIVPFLILLPMRYELRVAWLNFKNATTLRKKMVAIKHGIRFYANRVLLYFGYFRRRMTKRVFRPSFFVEEVSRR